MAPERPLVHALSSSLHVASGTDTFAGATLFIAGQSLCARLCSPEYHPRVFVTSSR
jgi:hypothetical protein